MSTPVFVCIIMGLCILTFLLGYVKGYRTGYFHGVVDGTVDVIERLNEIQHERDSNANSME